jgi:hypothetical protein
MIASDFLAEAKVQIDAGDHVTANAYLDAAKAGIDASRIDTIKAATKAALDDFERIESAWRLCRYALDTGGAGQATIRFLRVVENTPKPDLRQPITSAHNARAFAWNAKNRTVITDILHEAAAEASERRRL